MTKPQLKKQLESLTWITSKNPFVIHQYVFGSHYENTPLYKQLKALAEEIHDRGDYYMWKKRMCIYLFIGEYKYWVMWETSKKFTSLNRWKITGEEEKATKEQISKYENNS